MSYSLDPEIKKTFLEDGVVMLPGLLDDKLFEAIRSAADWSINNPGPMAVSEDVGDNIYRIENSNPAAQPIYREIVKDAPFADIYRQIWDSEHVWFYAEEVFWKKGDVPRTVWHQDTSYSPWGGKHWGGFWMPLNSIPKSNCLEVVRGSHNGTLYDGSAFDPEDPTKPFWGDRSYLPRMPDIEALRRSEPEKWDIASFDMEPGDALLFHPSSLHAGAPGDARMPDRRSLTLRFFGDDATFSDHAPDGDRLFTVEQQKNSVTGLERGNHGKPYRGPQFLQLF